MHPRSTEQSWPVPKYRTSYSDDTVFVVMSNSGVEATRTDKSVAYKDRALLQAIAQKKCWVEPMERCQSYQPTKPQVVLVLRGKGI